MGDWIETYRGMVKAWEVDPVEHLTVARYFSRLTDATLNFFGFCDLGPRHMSSERHALATVSLNARYLREFRAGDVLHVRTGVTEANDRGATLIQQIYDSATNTLAAEFEQRLRYMNLETRKGATLSAQQLERLVPHRIIWEPRSPLSGSPDTNDIPTVLPSAFDTVKPQELDILGHMSAEHYIHRFSDASTQTLAVIGMSPHYMRANRVGLSTFGFRMQFRRELHVGDRVSARSAVLDVGNASIQMLHRLYNEDTGDLAAELLQYGAHLNLDTRRPSRIPEEIRAAGQARIEEQQDGRN